MLWPAPVSRPDTSSRSSLHPDPAPVTSRPAGTAPHSSAGTVPVLSSRRPEVLLLMPQSLARITRTEAGGAIVTLQNRSAILIHPSVLRCVNAVVNRKEANEAPSLSETHVNAPAPAGESSPASIPSWRELSWWPLPILTVALFVLAVVAAWSEAWRAGVALMVGR